MLMIKCPWCGEREQIEFSAGGQAHIARPEDPATLSDEEWGAYIYVRDNPKGVHYERWVHSHGCGKWFNAVRHTVTDVFWDVYKMGEEKPWVPDDWDGVTTRAQYEAAKAAPETAEGGERT
jgi:sarcosine oxidase subunit delta